MDEWFTRPIEREGGLIMTGAARIWAIFPGRKSSITARSSLSGFGAGFRLARRFAGDSMPSAALSPARSAGTIGDPYRTSGSQAPFACMAAGELERGESSSPSDMPRFRLAWALEDSFDISDVTAATAAAVAMAAEVEEPRLRTGSSSHALRVACARSSAGTPPTRSASGPPLSWRRKFFRMVEFQRFLMALSVRPGSIFTILDHFVPIVCTSF
mmetsp:Transcript_6453/g.21215  ORF Transcript_6453/g.21215 Transcript_6453/m.21215 type:complete len:214 (+) Transcript_6453:933-1574(+)|eukprot:scaffold8245_cov97-Isochrysis_galbana.AAC.6